jgi:hypothetical protein
MSDRRIIIKKYHAFTTWRDEFVDTREAAEIIFNRMIKDFGHARLYIELYDQEGELISEDCIQSKGEYPG